MILRQEIRLNNSKGLIPFILLPILYIISARIQSPNFAETVRGPITTMLSLSVIYLTSSSALVSTQNLSLTFNFIGISLGISSLISIVTAAGLLGGSGNYLANKAFNPTGGPLPLITLLLTLLPAFAVLLVKSKNNFTKGVSVFTLLTGIPALIASLLLIRQGGAAPFIALPLSAGWNIAIEVFKAPLTALLGVGPSSFGNAYSLYKPISINSGALWNAKFGSSSNEILNLLTTVGIPATILLILAFVRSFMGSLKSKKTSAEGLAATVSTVVVTVLLFLVPASLPLLIIGVIMLSLLAIDQKAAGLTDDITISFFAAKVVKPDHDEMAEQKPRKETQILPWIMTVLSLALIVYMSMLHYRAYVSKYYFYQSLVAAASNDGTKAYNLQIEAIKNNIYDPTYRITYSQTNLAIANAIASKKDITETDKNNVATLIQQAIREAKAGVTLDPRNASTWQNLANVYRQLINLAADSDKWSIASYNRAIQLDPLNPQLRLDLGGVYYALGNYDQAINMFSQAVTAKANWANAHYNLAAAYKQKNEYQKALDSLNNVKRLLNAGSPDLERTDKEIAEIEKLLAQKGKDTKPATPTPTPTPNQGSQLVTPPALPPSNINPITLPETNGPDLNISGGTPTPTPQASPTPPPTQ
jgi:tetratricopeptide (TPR) repeat protein